MTDRLSRKAIEQAVAAGVLEPCTIIGLDGQLVRGYQPTINYERWFGRRRQAPTNVEDRT